MFNSREYVALGACEISGCGVRVVAWGLIVRQNKRNERSETERERQKENQ